MSATTIIRPEFQLIEATVDFKSTTGVEVKAGQLYARLYYPKDCTTTGQSIKGAVKLYDAIDKAGNRTICFIASPADYKQLHKACAKSNMAINRVRTIQLLERCFAANISDDIQAARNAAEVNRIHRACAAISNPWDTAEQYPAQVKALPQPSFTTQLCLPPAAGYFETLCNEAIAFAQESIAFIQAESDKLNAIADEALAKFPVLQAEDDSLTFVVEQDVDNEYLFVTKYTAKTARRLCRNWGIFCQQVPDSLVSKYAALQLAKRNVAPKAIKSFLNPRNK